ncbi:hypothetical protein AEP_00430 [Curvibacter sp. AEP1-3]|jgi:hypothetical protein|uniref:hypothetical protein n=1 Tax=Curvibacter sp. AEP1-3 TaxID=1844971 RepID=UPI000B3D2556|nr:hypothetical protein [Curvibacter sp. AEP1-3]ARV17392.1 hypothetical protein AEP_00430 [Curvibacter sp. AEP1-3]QDB70129.1 hypothetical protein [Curvibacter phage TJ1]
MKSFDQLAQAAYEAAIKKAGELNLRSDENFTDWQRLDPKEKEVWLAVAKQLWAEFAAMH